MTLCDFLNPAVPLGERVRHDLGVTLAGSCAYSFVQMFVVFGSVCFLQFRGLFVGAIVMYGILASGFPKKCLSKKDVDFLFL